MIGNNKKEPQKNEIKIKKQLRRSAAAAHNMDKDNVIQEKDIIWIRPGTGVKWEDRRILVGKKLNKAIKYAQLIKKTDVHQ